MSARNGLLAPLDNFSKPRAPRSKKELLMNRLEQSSPSAPHLQGQPKNQIPPAKSMMKQKAKPLKPDEKPAREMMVAAKMPEKKDPAKTTEPRRPSPVRKQVVGEKAETAKPGESENPRWGRRP